MDGSAAAMSLLDKGIVRMAGRGSVMEVPFTFVDGVWEYLLSNQSEVMRQLEEKLPEKRRGKRGYRR
jgi:hypothetical protein